MNQSATQATLRRTYSPDNFEVESLEDEIRVDNRCGQLLVEFLRHLTNNLLIPPEKASTLVRGADYFLRNYVISHFRENIFHLRPGRIRQFGGNWYIVQNLEPNIQELDEILQGIRIFYQWAESLGWISPLLLGQVDAECSLGEFYTNRIETFWSIEGNGYHDWDRDCSLND